MVSSKSTIIAGGRAKFAIFLICLVGGIELTLASRSCKNTVLKVLTERCGDSMQQRSRRATVKSEPTDVFQTLFDSLIPLAVEAFTKAMGESMKGMFPGYTSSIRSLQQSRGEPKASGSSDRRRRAPYQLNNAPSSMNDDLGLDLTIGEVEELYSDIFEKTHRQPSMTPDAAKDLFFDIATKCCRNENTCLREIKIQCP